MTESTLTVTTTPNHKSISLTSPQNPNTVTISTTQSPKSLTITTSPTTPPPPPKSLLSKLDSARPKLRVTSEFDSDTSLFFNKVSCKLLDGLAKLKLSFQNNKNGDVSEPQIGVLSKYVSVYYDVEEKNAFVKGCIDVGKGVSFRASQDIKAQQGEMVMVASLPDPAYKFELASSVPSVGFPKATFKFSNGEVSLEEGQKEEEEETRRVLSVSGIVRGQLLNGLCTAQYKNENLNLRYAYKDDEMSFIPTISLPSNAMSFAFKRRFGPLDKLSYLYNLNSSTWSSVYKRTLTKDVKMKAGYDSDVRLGWASLWVGDEDGKAKTAPMKMKVQFMLQVPQDDVRSSAIMFRVKKRWDF